MTTVALAPADGLTRQVPHRAARSTAPTPPWLRLGPSPPKFLPPPNMAAAQEHSITVCRTLLTAPTHTEMGRGQGLNENPPPPGASRLPANSPGALPAPLFCWLWGHTGTPSPSPEPLAANPGPLVLCPWPSQPTLVAACSHTCGPASIPKAATSVEAQPGPPCLWQSLPSTADTQGHGGGPEWHCLSEQHPNRSLGRGGPGPGERGNGTLSTPRRALPGSPAPLGKFRPHAGPLRAATSALNRPTQTREAFCPGLPLPMPCPSADHTLCCPHPPTASEWPAAAQLAWCPAHGHQDALCS